MKPLRGDRAAPRFAAGGFFHAGNHISRRVAPSCVPISGPPAGAQSDRECQPLGLGWRLRPSVFTGALPDSFPPPPLSIHWSISDFRNRQFPPSLKQLGNPRCRTSLWIAVEWHCRYSATSWSVITSDSAPGLRLLGIAPRPDTFLPFSASCMGLPAPRSGCSSACSVMISLSSRLTSGSGLGFVNRGPPSVVFGSIVLIGTSTRGTCHG